MNVIAPRRQGRPPTMENPQGRILDEAAERFAKTGYDGASLGDIADAVGITKAAIYHYFPNKKEIYEAIIVRTLAGLLTSVTEAVGREQQAEAALYRFMAAHADYFEAHYFGFATMLVGYGGMESPAMVAEAHRLRDEYEALLRKIIGNGIRNGRYRRVDINVTSRAILSMLNWMVRWYRPGHGRPASAFAKEYCDLMLNGMKNLPSDPPGKRRPASSRKRP